MASSDSPTPTMVGLVAATQQSACNNNASDPSKTNESEENPKEKDKETGEKKEEEGNKRKEMAPRSEMWSHFTKIKVGGHLKKGKCNYCHREIKADPNVNGTSALRTHFNTCKCNPHRNKDPKQGYLQVNQGDSVTTYKYDPDAIRNALAQMVIEDELPFASCEKPGFRKFMSIACPRWSVPSRRTITRDTVSIYFEEKAKLKTFFKQSCERVCLTTDTWTSQQQDSYMAVTAHFVDHEWKLHKKIISFFKVKGHKGDDIGKNIQRCLVDWGINKVMTITVDNASPNDGGVDYIRRQMNNQKTSIALGKYLHMRCAAHIINLIVSDGLKVLDSSVKRVRAAVRFIKNGTSRLVKFKKLAELENLESNAFLTLDVCTRWNSTYLMLKSAIIYEKVFARYEEEDPTYTIELCGEKGPGIPDECDWENAKKMAEFLGHFYDLTLRVSTTLQVTANEFFHEIGEVNVLLREWADSEDELRQAMAKRMKDKYDKYWGNWHEKENENENEGRGKGRAREKEKENMNLLIFIATALDPRYKLSSYTKLAIGEMFGEEKGCKVWDAVNGCFNELFEEYRNIYAPSDLATQTNDSEQPHKRGGRLMKSLIAKKMRTGNCAIGTSKSEIEKYLGEDNEEDSSRFDILEWWKVNSSRFPILARMAHDVLAIPISTVASECAFSTSGRVLDDFRTSLTPFMVQVLICTQDWIRRSTPINIEENEEELAKIEEELLKEYEAEKAATSTKSKSTTQSSSKSVTKPSSTTASINVD